MLHCCEFTVPGMRVKYLIDMPTVPRVGDEIDFEEFQGAVERVRVLSSKPEEPGEERFFIYRIYLSKGWH